MALRRWRELTTFGDASPVDHGGGSLFKSGRDYVIVYNRIGLSDLPSEFCVEDEDGGEEETRMEVLFLEPPKTFAEFVENYGDADWKSAWEYSGAAEDDRGDLERMLREMRFAKGDEFVKKASYMLEMLLMTGADVGGNVETPTAAELREIFDTGRF